MIIERQAIPESKVNDAAERIRQAWLNLVKAGQEETYKKMSEQDLKEMREKMKKGESPGEGREYIAEYLNAVNDYLSR